MLGRQGRCSLEQQPRPGEYEKLTVLAVLQAEIRQFQAQKERVQELILGRDGGIFEVEEQI